MDVTGSDFDQRLRSLLAELAGAHFVAFDLEFSGINLRNTQTAKPKVHGHVGKQTLQQRYEDTKEAAEKYQVLQCGFTIVTEDQSKGSYFMRPYNMDLSPLIPDNMGIDRDFSFNSKTIEFLLREGFRVDGPFTHGVQYLSRVEEALAIKYEESRADRANILDIQLGVDEDELLTFVMNTRRKITEWVNKKPRPEILLIAPGGYQVSQYTERGLSRLQKRLVHQLVRAEFTEFCTMTRAGAIQIIPYDEEREEKIKKARMAGFKAQVQKAVGLRWFVEAMIGGEVQEIDAFGWSRSADGKPIWVDLKKAQKEQEELQKQLLARRTVLVGHNIFVDLIYFYKTFIGKLPDRVEDFAAIIHELFPLVIDTKYVATHNNDANDAKSGLSELDQEFAHQLVPEIEIDPVHPKYNNFKPSHEAGYDALITAKVLVRLATKIHSLGYYSDDEEFITAPHSLCSPSVVGSPEDLNLLSIDRVHTTLQPNSTLQAAPTHQPAEASSQATVKRKLKNKRKTKPKKEQSAFAHPGRFDLLSFDDDSPSPSVPSSNSSEDAVDGVDGADDEEDVAEEVENGSGGVQLSINIMDLGIQERKAGADVKPLMPRWESGFWMIYGNKLRVNGTEEGICFLDDEER